MRKKILTIMQVAALVAMASATALWVTNAVDKPLPKPNPATKAQPLDQIAGYKCTVVSTAANEATLMETLVIEQSDDRGKTWWRYMMVPTSEGTNTYVFRSRAHTFYRIRFNKWSAFTVPR